MPEKKLALHFPKRFLWGASISTHQVEGNNDNQWSRWELETAQVKVAQARYNYKHLKIWPQIEAEATRPENYVSGKAADHFNRYEHDFDLARQLHFSALRTGIEWSRLEPRPGEFDNAAFKHYKQYFEALKDRNITPIITLWHWTFPQWFAEKGGFAKRRNLKYFRRFVARVTEELGSHFQYVITINEPTVYAVMSYHERRWPPEQRSKLLTLGVLLNLARAHRQAYKIIKKRRPRTKIGLAHNCAYYYAGDDSLISKLVALGSRMVTTNFFINRVRRHQDFFGLNYYFANRIIGTRVHNPEKQLNDLGWDMQPDKLLPLIRELHGKYKKPIFITETGLADKNDQYRKWWITEEVKAMNQALAEKIPLIGYIHWSMLDNFEWAEGFWPRFGLIEVNYKTQQRTVRPSARWYSRLIKTLQG